MIWAVSKTSQPPMWLPSPSATLCRCATSVASGTVAKAAANGTVSRIDPATRPEAVLRHGRVGTMRLTLPSRPLLVQWDRRVRQFVRGELEGPLDERRPA